MSETGNEPVLMSTTNLEYAVQKWSVEDLKFANHIVVHELKQRYAQDANVKLQKFRIGQRVKFISKYGISVEGTIEKINRRTVSLSKCTDNKRWLVGNLDKLEVVS